MNEVSVPNDYDSYTVDELLELEFPQTGSLFDQLGGITATASADGVEVTVNLEGRLIGLELGPHALSLAPVRLAAEIFRLTQQASADALTEGIAALAPVAGDELTAELTELVGMRPTAVAPAVAPVEVPAVEEPKPARRPRTLDDHEDFSAIESWAVR